jgi:hypothetical protein
MSRSLVTLLGLIAFAAAMLLPLHAQAAILQACEIEPASTMAPAAPEPLCALVRLVDEATGETSAAPICDPRGASAVAPPRILPIPDARIEIRKTCSSPASSPALSPDRRSESVGHAVALERAVVPEDCLLAAPAFEVELEFLPVRGAFRAGVTRGVYHPPRS